MSRILIVDDSLDSLLVACAAVEAGGHEAIGTTDPAEAMDVVRRGQAEAVILDIVMPRISGFELLRQIRECPAGATLPVLFLSGLTASDDRVRGLRAGADDYLDKPPNPSELLARIDRLLSRFGRTGAQLAGNFSGLSFADLLQILSESRRQGTVHVNCDGRDGTIGIVAGTIRSASFDRHRGRRAMLELLEATDGSFRFASADEAPDPSREPVVSEPIDLRSCLFESAWVADELRNRPWMLPEDGHRLVANREPGLEARREDVALLPLREIYEAVRAHGRPTVAELLELGHGPSRHLRLAISLLVEWDCVHLEGSVPRKPPADRRAFRT